MTDHCALPPLRAACDTRRDGSELYNAKELFRALKNGHHVESEAALQLFHIAEFKLWHELSRA
ncbi:MAG: hypothetical protein DMD33_16760 [Gemmatimonadetes bacterium]|nr:MAG: hypothetical protein DMD33_16760 [Gemmatimonadota bacterium]PYO71932.1 MAG: hypothetical protein DMD67_17760 [Gemmatimonadota bacterium]